MAGKITVYKRDHHGAVTLEYEGEVVAREATWVCLNAYFHLDFVDRGVINFRKGDKMTEWFYTDRRYNIFQVHDGDSDVVKGWYCNVTRPAEITEDSVSQDDLALDVVVSPTGEITQLDEDEFEVLDISPEERMLALESVEMLYQMVARREGVFAVIESA